MSPIYLGIGPTAIILVILSLLVAQLYKFFKKPHH